MPHHAPSKAHKAVWPLALASLGVIYGDIGTSPLYALRETLAHAHVTTGDFSPRAVYGVASLMLWTLLIIATFKYVLFILRADNKGEGGTLALMTLAQRAMGRRTPAILLMGMLGCGLFYGDALITPAISVLSAMEGIALITPRLEHYILPITVAILTALFMVQRHGTGSIARLFGPVMLVWFSVLLVTGLWQIWQHPNILAAFNPLYGLEFISHHGIYGILALGGVFLVVTGAETMYADLGHFGRPAITRAWVSLVLPALAANYLGQAALVIAEPGALANPFFLMVPQALLPFLVALATLATIIASQAVIAGAFSISRQAVQLGLLPRLDIRHTSEYHIGQIYIPKINWLLMAGVLLLVLTFRTSGNLAGAYGIAVSGIMVLTGLFSFVVFSRVFRWPTWVAIGLSALFITVDFTYFAVNLSKIHHGGWLPLAFAGGMVVVMHIWTKGNAYISKKTKHTNWSWPDFIQHVKEEQIARVPGTAIFLTADLSLTPSTLTSNLALNKVLHERNFVVTVTIMPTPYVDAERRIIVHPLPPAGFIGVRVFFGYAETPNLTRTLGYHLKKHGVEIDVHESVFIIGHRRYKASASRGLSLWQDYVYLLLNRNNVPPTDFYHLPPPRVLELGTQLVI